MTALVSFFLALHVSGDHGILNPYILVPASLVAVGYYAVTGTAGMARAGLVQLLSGGGQRAVTVERVRIGLRAPVIFEGIQVESPPGASAGSVLTVDRMELPVRGPALLGSSLAIPRIDVACATISTKGVETRGIDHISLDPSRFQGWTTRSELAELLLAELSRVATTSGVKAEHRPPRATMGRD